MKIGYAILIGMMLMFLIPRAKQMVKESPKGSTSDWQGALIPLVLVILFVLLLINMA